MSLFECTYGKFQRLEDISSYTSVIKSFGRPIIPPLMTSQERIKIAHFRAALLEKQRLKDEEKSKANLKNVGDKDYSISKSNKVSVPVEVSHPINCALNSTNLNAFNRNMSKKDMLVSLSKIPCNGICSTVHNDVIVCSNESKSHFDERNKIEAAPSASDSNSDYNDSFSSENDCSCPACEPKLVPYETLNSKVDDSVSEEDQESAAEEGDFASLPTVIFNKKIQNQDTDSESIITFMTQSTDLEKYMDCSVEFSSPDDPAALLISQSSNPISISSRSEEASSETVVNTENELTPCASAMARLSVEESNKYIDPSAGKFSSADSSNYNTDRRANSVDSFMKILKTCAKNLYLKKYQSEPTQQEAEQIHITFLTPESQPGKLLLNTEKVGPNYTESSSSSNLLTTNDCNSLVDNDSHSDDGFQRGHIRRNSYTLSHPSSALVEAHADCNCQEDQSPHSCSSQYQNILLSVAFKKEPVNIILPPLPDRKKMFPVINMNQLTDKQDIESSNVGDSSSNSADQNYYYNSKESSPASSSVTMASYILANDLKSSEQSCAEENLMINDNVEQNNLEQNSLVQDTQSKIDPEILLTKLREELEVSRKMRVNQLIEEQNKQWLRLEDEFKEQERSLIEKLKHSGMFLSSEESSHNQSFTTETNASTGYYTEHNSSQVGTMKSSDSNSTNLSSGSDSYPTVIQNDLDENKCPPPLYSNIDVVLPAYISSTESNSSPVTSTSRRSETNSSNLQNFHINQQDYDSYSNSYNDSCVELQNVKLPIHSKSNSQGETSAAVFIRNDISKPEESIKHSTQVKLIYEKNNTSPKQDLEVCLPKQTNEPIKKIKSFVQPLPPNPKATNLKKQNNTPKTNVVQANQLQTSSNMATKQGSVPHGFNQNANSKSNSKTNADSSSCCDSNANIPVHYGNFPQGQSVKIQLHQVPPSLLSLPKSASKSAVRIHGRKPNRFVNNPQMLKRFEKLPALVKGYLTRRLFNTERVQGLINTLKETAVLMQNLSDELSLRGSTISERDLELHNRLLAQLLGTFQNLYDIFCTISTKERMKIITESRQLRLKKLLAENKSEVSDTVVSAEYSTSGLSQKPLSSATLKSLQRRKRSIDSSTYTVEKFKDVKRRSHSTCSAKHRTKSPASTNHSAFGTNLHRKSKSCIKAIHPRPFK